MLRNSIILLVVVVVLVGFLVVGTWFVAKVLVTAVDHFGEAAETGVLRPLEQVYGAEGADGLGEYQWKQKALPQDP